MNTNVYIVGNLFVCVSDWMVVRVVSGLNRIIMFQKYLFHLVDFAKICTDI